MSFKGGYSALAALVLLGACQHNTEARPALLERGDTASLAALKSHLADTMGLAQVKLGADDPTRSSTISVLPPALGTLETRSPARPAIFRLYVRAQTCFAVQDGSAQTIDLHGVSCIAG